MKEIEHRLAIEKLCWIEASKDEIFINLAKEVIDNLYFSKDHTPSIRNSTISYLYIGYLLGTNIEKIKKLKN